MGAQETAFGAGEGSVERRASVRQTSKRPARIVFGDKTFARDCTIRELSEAGARVAMPDPSSLPDHVILLEPDGLVAYEATVRWRRGNLMGLSFDRMVSLDGELSMRYRALRQLLSN